MKDTNDIEVSLSGMWAECISNRFQYLKYRISGKLLEELRPAHLVSSLIDITHRINEEIKDEE